MRRIADEPAFVLHRYDWSESSLILEVLTRHHGRIAVVAKGAKKPSSNFRPVLLPLQPLRVSFGGDAEIRTLKGAEWVGGQVMPTGDAFSTDFEELMNDRFLFGSPAEVTEQILVLQRRFGINTLLLGIQWVGMPASLAMEQMQLISEQIFPAVRAAG